MRKYITTMFMALALLVFSFAASAWNAPVTQQQIDLNAYHLATWQTSSNTVTPLFYSSNSNLAQVKIFNLSGVLTKKHLYSFQTKIGGSQLYPNGSMYYNIMCPDGRNSTLVNHINIAKANFQPNVYLDRDDGTACGSSTPPPPPTNQTSLATVQAAYPRYQVTRLYPNEDIFKVYCVAGACNPYQSWNDTTGETWYLSNMNAIGYVFSIHRYDLNQYVRAPESIAIQSAKDDINVLANIYFGGYVTWVFDSTTTLIRWW